MSENGKTEQNDLYCYGRTSIQQEDVGKPQRLIVSQIFIRIVAAMALSLQRYTHLNMDTGINKLLKQRLDEEKERSKLVVMEKIDHHLPESLISEILSWLPVKDLLQFKSVCQAWYSLISSPDFSSKHLKNYYNNNDSWRTCLFVVFEINYLIEVLVDETPQVLDWEYLYSLPMRQDYVCGPCDGIYYLYQHDYNDRALWNPAINELKPLPEIVHKPGALSNYTDGPAEHIGFGKDPVTADYKVVVLKTYWNISDVVSVIVYSLRTNSWRYCGDLTRPYLLDFGTCYMYLDGFYFWFGSDRHSTTQVIISFDMATDEFKEIDVPDYAKPSAKLSCRRLAIYNSALALLYFDETNSILDIWTFTQGSWSKTFTMDSLHHIWAPIGHWKDNFIMLQTRDCKLVLLDTHSMELKVLGLKYKYQSQGVFAYMESLVSIKDKVQVAADAT